MFCAYQMHSSMIIKKSCNDHTAIHTLITAYILPNLTRRSLPPSCSPSQSRYDFYHLRLHSNYKLVASEIGYCASNSNRSHKGVQRLQRCRLCSRLETKRKSLNYCCILEHTEIPKTEHDIGDATTPKPFWQEMWWQRNCWLNTWQSLRWPDMLFSAWLIRGILQ